MFDVDAKELLLAPLPLPFLFPGYLAADDEDDDPRADWEEEHLLQTLSLMMQVS